MRISRWPATSSTPMPLRSRRRSGDEGRQVLRPLAADLGGRKRPAAHVFRRIRATGKPSALCRTGESPTGAQHLLRMSRWQGKLEHKQRFLGRIVDIGAELFAMTAACVRAQRDRADGTAVELADAFCRRPGFGPRSCSMTSGRTATTPTGRWLIECLRVATRGWRRASSIRRLRGHGSRRTAAPRTKTCIASSADNRRLIHV